MQHSLFNNFMFLSILANKSKLGVWVFYVGQKNLIARSSPTASQQQ